MVQPDVLGGGDPDVQHHRDGQFVNQILPLRLVRLVLHCTYVSDHNIIDEEFAVGILQLCQS